MTTASWGELIWPDLDRQLQEQEDNGRECLWAGLNETASISNYRPGQARGVVHRRLESRREGVYYVLNSPLAGTYLKLDERDFYLWGLMDGSRPVKELVVAYFYEYGSIAFGRVARLVS